MSKGKPLEFSFVPLDQVRSQTGKPATEQMGSVYDPILHALRRQPHFAVKITREALRSLAELTPQDRDRIQSSLKTMANNRGTPIETRVKADAVYAWIKR